METEKRPFGLFSQSKFFLILTAVNDLLFDRNFVLTHKLGNLVDIPGRIRAASVAIERTHCSTKLVPGLQNSDPIQIIYSCHIIGA